MSLKSRLDSYLVIHTDRHRTKWLKSRDHKLWGDIVAATQFLSDSAVPKQRCWHILNEVWEIPLCPVDRIPVSWFDNRYLTYSSRSAKSRCSVYIERKVQTQRANKEALSGCDMSLREIYRKEVWRHTKRNWYHHKHEIQDSHLRSREFHLDHIYSLVDGFKNNIPAEVVGHWCNFRILPAAENLTKHMKSDITIDELMKLINPNL